MKMMDLMEPMTMKKLIKIDTVIKWWWAIQIKWETDTEKSVECEAQMMAAKSPTMIWKELG